MATRVCDGVLILSILSNMYCTNTGNFHAQNYGFLAAFSLVDADFPWVGKRQFLLCKSWLKTCLGIFCVITWTLAVIPFSYLFGQGQCFK